MGVSVDSVPCNAAWAQSLGGIEYPLLSDFWPHGHLCKEYGVLRDDGMAERAIFVIGPDAKVEHVRMYDIAELPQPHDALKVIRAVTRV